MVSGSVVFGQVAVDGGLQVDERMEDAATEAAAGELGEEALDRIEPGCRGRGEVERPARMPGQPSSDFGVLVAAIIVEDHMDQLAGRDVALEAVEKTRNSWWRCRCMHWPTIVPSSTLSAANKVVVPWRY